MAEPIKIAVGRLAHAADLPLPEYQTPESAGMDLCAALNQPLVLRPLDRVAVPCGLAMALPAGYEAQVRPRSGLALKHGIGVINAPGTIDADYRGELKVPLINLGRDDFTITRGMRIAQLVIAPVSRAQWQPVAGVEDLPASERGAGGFGSTGQ